MPHAFADIAFTPAVKAAQAADGSRGSYERNFGAGAALFNHELGEAEADFIAAQRSFFMATVSETGWPYVQHRGGPAGFVQALDAQSLGFLDYAGNRQLISVGNVAGNPRVALIFMDYARQARLKLLGQLRFEPLQRDDPLQARLLSPGYRARPQRLARIQVEGYDWNCSQHIPQRFEAEDVDLAIKTRDEEIAALKARLQALTQAG